MIDIMENKILGPAIRKGIEQGRTEGRAEGRTEGRIEGRAEGERLVLSRQLTTKFGPLPEAVLGRLRTASETELSSWVDRVLTAHTLDEVFN